MVITIDIETISLQGVGAQQGDTMSQMTQLLVQLFSVHPRAHGVRMVGADDVHSSGCPILLSPKQGQSAARVQWANAGVLEQETKQVIQGLLSGVELCRAWMPHVWCIEHVCDGEIEGKGHWAWTHICRAVGGGQRCWGSWRECGYQSASGGNPVLMVVTIDGETVPVQDVGA